MLSTARNIYWLGIKELWGLARDPMMLFLIAWALSASVYVQANGMPDTLQEAAIAIVDEDGTRTVLAFHWPGDMFGLSEGDVYINTAVALLRIPQLQNDLLLKSAAELRVSQRNRLLRTLHPASRKMAGFLLEIVTYPQCFNSVTGVATLPFSRSDIAAFLDMKIETASRAMLALEAANMVKRLSVRNLKLNVAALERFAQHSDATSG